MRAGLFAVGVVVAAGGCDLDGPQYDNPDAYVAPDNDAGSTLATRGRFEVIEGVDLTEDGAAPYSRMEGVITTGDVGALYQVDRSAGSCDMLRLAQQASCSGGCTGLCIADEQCVAAPTNLSAGRIDITGLTQTIAFERQSDNRYLGEGPLPLDLFTSEAVVRLYAAGDDVIWFFMSTGGVRPLDTDLPLTPVVLDGSGDLDIRWDNPDITTHVVLELYAQTQLAGELVPAIVHCREQDDGSLSVPRELLAEFPTAKATCTGFDCQRARLRRQHMDSLIRSNVPLELVVAHEVRFAIEY